ncbi:response regulator [Bacillaceae bacterium Marseille-Q3522]|nr:response regulator [Bacillaceae bacterium Marseille-Q3522]
MAVIVLFIIILTGLRFGWLAVFYHKDQPQAVNGILDLRDWSSMEDITIKLDGQWEFYPHVFLMNNEMESSKLIDIRKWNQVPGTWNHFMQPDESTPYGYGSYRLRILVNPEHDYTYSIRIPSVRSSSELYVNGELLARSGKPAANKQDYAAENVPYTASFRTNGSDVIEVIVQAANFIDTRESGIVRSIKFGTEAAIARETQLSVSLQEVVAVVLLLNALYAIILYLIGTREKNLLYLSLLFISVMVLHLLGSEEKLLHIWLPINYEWGFKLVHLAMMGFTYSILLFLAPHLPAFLRKIYALYIILCAAGAILSLLLPAHNILIIQPFYATLMAISTILSILVLFNRVLGQIKDNIFMLLGFIALTSSFTWWMINVFTGIKIVYYPFDIVISSTCFASVWLKNYFEVHNEARKLATKLKKADKQKDEFLANTSHELRNPLHGVLNISQAVLEREKYSLSERSIKDLESVLSVGRRMSLMLNDLLDAVSLKQSAPRLQYRSFSVYAIATGVLDMLLFMTEGKPVQLVNRIPENLPHVYADENRVIQIIYNLLHNAVKYTNEGEVSIRGYVKGGKVYIAVSDTGIGMDQQTLQRVFEPYEQGESGKTLIKGGFGLGLSISKQLVEMHGGTLQVSSAPGKGSEFIFTLQLSNLNETESETSIPEASEASTFVAASMATKPLKQIPKLANRPRILVVDDDPVNLKVVESILSQEQYDIKTVTSGEKALDVLDSKEWDLVISDVMMPKMSGYELSRRIRKRFTITELPILLLTARSKPEDIENGFLAGANDYVSKPVDAMEVRSRVKALTDVKQSVRDRLQMEAAWLQAQIQPHFLFNTLNSVIALSEIDLDQMHKLIEVLCDFLRNKFKFQNMDELADIEDELNIVRSYLYIEQIRFGDRLKVSWEIDECKELKIPLLTIQPLVENAVRHGIMKQARGGTLLIRISNHETHAEISVEDDGVGMDELTLQQILKRTNTRSGVGLINTDLRLKRHFGKGLQIKSIPGNGTSISFNVRL